MVLYIDSFRLFGGIHHFDAFGMRFDILFNGHSGVALFSFYCECFELVGCEV